MEEKKQEEIHDAETDPHLNEGNSDASEHKEDKKEKHAKSKHRKEDKADKLEKEVSDLNDKYLRLYSEFDNFRKRTLREKAELSRTASADVITSLLPVIDDLERAYAAVDLAGESHAATKDGLGLILNKFLNILTQSGLEPIKALGETFDTDFHEAITNIPASSPEMKGKIIDVVEKGYLLGGKVIRYAKVVVGN